MVVDKSVDGGGAKPVPDPTFLTTEALQREIKGLGDLLRTEIRGDRDANKIHFESIMGRFDAVERQRVEQKADTEKAVQAALLAQKEAVREQTIASQLSIDKSERGMKDQSSQQNATVMAQLAAITDKINDLSARVGTIEAVKIGGAEMKLGARLDLGSVLGVISVIIVIVGLYLNSTR